MPKRFIKNITDLKNCGVFNSWPKGHIGFGRYNLLYGWNGSGKTTLSRIMRSLEEGAVDPALTEEDATPSFEFQLQDDSTISSKNLAGWHDKIRVFNCDFVRKNINTDNAEAQPVYHLGKQQGDALEKLQGVRTQLEKSKAELTDLESRHDDATELKETALTENARLVREAIRDTRFDARRLRGILDTFREDGTDIAAFILNEPDVQTVLNTAIGNNDKGKIEVLPFSPKVTIEALHANAQKACNTSVTKAAIEELDANAELRKWVEKGIALHKDKNTCGFCASKIQDVRLTFLNQYFNDAYNNLMDDISRSQGMVESLIAEIEAVKPPDESRFYPAVREEYKSDAKILGENASALVTVCKEINTTLGAKRGRLTEPVPVTALEILQEKGRAFSEALDAMNKTIKRHNEQFDNFEMTAKEARNKIINHYSARHYASFNASMDLLDSLEGKITPAKETIRRLRLEEAELDAQLREHDVAVDRINELLASFLGRSDIKLITHDKGYYIEREGERAKYLSEGESTAIAFTYFIAKMEEKEFDIENSVIVVDDPISSLDTNSLYAAGSFIRCHLERASQVFILTHNYQFFREIFGWMKRLEKPKSWPSGLPYTCEIMLRCEVGADGKRVATPCRLDNTLRKYDTEYLFLFQQLYEAHGSVKFTEDASPDMLSKLMLLPNVARRVLETFVLFKFPDVANGSIIGLYKTITPLDVKIPPEKISILDRLLNRISHGGEDGMASFNMFNLSETPKVIEYVLNFIEQADPLHFAGLKRAIGIKETTVPKSVPPNDNQKGENEAA